MTKSSFLQRLPSQYLLPLLMLAALSSGSIFVLLFVVTGAQDQQEAARESAALRTALDTNVAMVRRDLQDYAKWNDAVVHISRHFDANWIDDNVTAYLGKAQGYDHVFVIGPDSRTVYAFSHGRRSTANAGRELGPSFVRSAAAVRAIDPAGKPIISGFTRAGDKLYLFSVGAIVPLTDKVSLPPGGEYLLAIAQQVDSAFLAQLRAEHHLPRLGLATARPGRPIGLVPVNDLRQMPLAYVTLEFRRPGTLLRQDMLPGLALILLAVLIIAGFILQQGSLSLNALRVSKQHALHAANHDPLTGLANRRLLLDGLATALERGESVFLLYMDLDGFKEVNDLHGHATGDALLCEVARRLTDAAGEGRLVARTGGDEFAFVGACQPTPDGDGSAFCDRILHSFRQSFPIEGTQVQVGVSIGLVRVTALAPSVDVDELMRRADVAMYHAKASGKHRWIAYAPEMDAAHDIRKRLENDLRTALEQGGIEVAFQPIVRSADERIVGVEALARWTHPVEGPIPPDIFIQLAENAGLISQLGEQVLRIACRATAPLDLSLAVNLSPAQLCDADLVSKVEGILAQTGFPASRLELEITENYLFARPDAAADMIDALRRLGIRIALDDFGSGFASIGQLQRFSFDQLKIDRRFVSTALVDEAGRELLVAMVALGKALRLEITAEGVETEREAGLVHALGCHRMQGWHYGRPGSIGIVEARMTPSRRERHVAADGAA